MKLNRALLFGLPAVALLLFIFSMSAPDITDLDNDRISQVTCSDLPADHPTVIDGTCVTSRDALGIDDNDGQLIEHPLPFIVALALTAWWAWLLYRSWKAREDEDVQHRTATGMAGGYDVRRPPPRVE